MKKIVEFFGLPSSGKSTIAKSILEKNKNYKDEFMLFKTFNGIKSFIPTLIHFLFSNNKLYKKCIFKMFYIFLRNRENKNAFKKLLKLLRINLIYSKNNDYYITSEGIIQCIFEINDYLKNQNKDVIDSFIKVINIFMNMYPDNIYVFLDIDIEKAYANIRKRNSPNNTIDKMDDKQLYNVLEKRKQFEKIIFSEFKDNKNFYVINSNSNINSVIDNVYNSLITNL